MHIALLEDDIDQMALIELWVAEAGHVVTGFPTIGEFIRGLKSGTFELLILDWMLPDGSGADALEWVRQTLGWEIPIIILTGQDDESTVVQALNAGADDYIVKPARQPQLLARIAAVARRLKPANLAAIRLGAYEVDTTKHTLKVNGQSIPLTQKEYDLAFYLIQSPGKLLSRDHLLNKIWGIDAEVDTRTVDTHVSRLRKKLMLDGSAGWKLTPIYGFGYRLDQSSTAS